jgi:hypothetical protein
MSRIFGFVGILAVLAVGMYIYSKQIQATSAPGGATANPRAAVDVVGVKNDLIAIAQAEKRYWATNGKYTSIDELISNGDISMQKPSRGSFSYSSDFSDEGFTITATNSSGAGGEPKTMSIDQTMQVKTE